MDPLSPMQMLNVVVTLVYARELLPLRYWSRIQKRQRAKGQRPRAGPKLGQWKRSWGFYILVFWTYLVYIVSFAAAITSLWLSFVGG